MDVNNVETTSCVYWEEGEVLHEGYWIGDVPRYEDILFDDYYKMVDIPWLLEVIGTEMYLSIARERILFWNRIQQEKYFVHAAYSVTAIVVERHNPITYFLDNRKGWKLNKL